MPIACGVFGKKDGLLKMVTFFNLSAVGGGDLHFFNIVK